jgi:hypothetical protein
MPNTFNNVKDVGGIIAKAGAKLFEDNLMFCKSVAKADESDFEGKNGFKSGETIYINLPMRSTPTSNFDQTGTIQDVVEGKKPLALNIISSQAFEVNSSEFATKIGLESVMNRIIKPAAVSMAHDFENKVLAQATDAIFNSVGTPGVNEFDPDVILGARQKLNENLCPKNSDERFFLFNSRAGRKAVNARKGLFQSASEIASQYKEGYIGMADGFNWLESEMTQTHTNGNDVVFEVRTTVSTQGQATLVVEALTANTGTVTKGTVFTIAGVFAVHPQTKEAYSGDDGLQQFTVLADATADASGFATLSVSPAMYTTGSLKNIATFPQDGNAITPVGAASTGYKQNIAFHKNSFRLATVPLIMPKNAEFAAQHTYKGMTFQVVYDWDQIKRSMVLRMDVLGGLCEERPEWACRVPN